MELINMRQGDYGLSDMIRWTNLDGILMLEVGSYQGESAEIFSCTRKVKTIWCIDPWKPGYDDQNDGASTCDFTEVETEFDKRAAKYPSIIHKFKGTLEGFIKEFPDINPDLVYIDAMHTYDACKNDILNALRISPKFISGHDYDWTGVKEAVDEIFGKPDMTFSDTSWAVDMRGKYL